MAGLKALAKDTAIYGLSSIVGRFLNYLLVPIYAAAMSAESGGYGVVTEVYAWTALLLVILTYGMETTFFRYMNKDGENPQRVYSTVLIMIGSTSLLFAALCMVFLQPIADAMGYSEHPWYVGMMTLVVAMDAFQCIPFSYLRYKKRHTLCGTEVAVHRAEHRAQPCLLRIYGRQRRVLCLLFQSGMHFVHHVADASSA
jgi:O-antigen/teichoic acid export membrane protein